MNKQLKITLIVALVLVLSTACGSSAEPAPTVNPVEVMTQVAGTIQAEVTQNALLTPSPTATMPPTPTPPPAPVQTLPPAPTQPTGGGNTTLPADSPDKMRLVSESIPDGSNYWQGERFTKSWTLENVGTTTWTTSYQLIYYDGTILSGEILAVSIQNPVKPGVQVEISVPMEAPDTLGTYISYWRLINEDGAPVILMHEEEDVPIGTEIWVEIDVVTEAEKTVTPSG